jgi:hypothetical protein
MDPLWPPACTGYPGADNNGDNNANYDHRDSHGDLNLIIEGKRSHEECPTKKVQPNIIYLSDFVKG